MKGIVIASHGRLAEGMLDTLKIFAGEQEQLETLCLMPGDDIDGFIEKIRGAVDRVDTGEGVVVFCDLLFGSPCNCSARLFGDAEYQKKMEVITGMNLSMVLEFAGSRGSSEYDGDALIQTGRNGIVDLKKLMNERKSRGE